MGLLTRALSSKSEILDIPHSKTEIASLLGRSQKLRKVHKIGHTTGIFRTKKKAEKQKLTSNTRTTPITRSNPPTPSQLDKDLGLGKNEYQAIYQSSVSELANTDQSNQDYHSSLFNILKDLNKTTKKERLWDTFCEGIIDKLGAQSIVVFSKDEIIENKETHDKNDSPFFNLCWTSGLSQERNSILNINLAEQNNLSKYLKTHKQIQKIKDIPKSIFIETEEKKILAILKKIETKLIFTLNYANDLLAIIIIGPKFSNQQYTHQDLNFLQELRDLASIHFLYYIGNQTANKLISHSKTKKEVSQKEINKLNIQEYKSIFSLAHLSSRSNNLETLSLLFSEYLEHYLLSSQYSIVLFSIQKGTYCILRSNGLDIETQNKYSLSLDTNLVGSISSIRHIYHLDNFKQNEEVIPLHSQNDLEKMGNYWIIPLIHLTCLVGFISIHDLKNSDWDAIKQKKILTLSKLFSPPLMNALIKQNKSLPLAFQNPFVALKLRIEKELSYAKTKDLPFSLIILSLDNLDNLADKIEKRYLRLVISQITEVLRNFLQANQYLNRLDLGDFVIILPRLSGIAAKVWLNSLLELLPKRSMSNKIEDIKRLKYKSKIIFPSYREIDAERIISALF